MAVAAVFQLAVPAPHNATLVNGEQALSVATPIAAAVGATTYRLAKWFDFNGGNYMIRSVSADVALWFTSVSLGNARMLFATTNGQAVTERTVYIPRGRSRLDVALTNVGTGASECYIAFSIWQYGKLVYASSGTGWVFDTTVIPDASVPALGDRRLSFPLFPLLPNWQGGVTERWEWKSEVMVSEADAEQRRSLRRYPRRSIEASFMRQGVDRSRLDSFIMGTGKREFLLPLWHEQVVLTATLGATYIFAAGGWALSEFTVGELVVAYVSPTSNEILSVASVAGDVITFTAAPAQVWPAGTLLVPLRVAQLNEPVQFENHTDNVATVRGRFDLVEPTSWPTASWGATAQLFPFVPNRATPLAMDYSRKTFMLDSETGPVEDTDVGNRARIGMRFNLTLLGKSKVVALKALMQSARGRTVRFWIPNFTDDIQLSTDIAAGTFLDGLNSGFSKYGNGPQAPRLTLAILFKDGSPTIYRTVSSVTDSGTFERFVVTTALPAITAASVLRVTFMLPARFDQDGFELHHHVDGSAAVQTSIVVRSTDSTGMPAII